MTGTGDCAVAAHVTGSIEGIITTPMPTMAIFPDITASAITAVTTDLADITVSVAITGLATDIMAVITDREKRRVAFSGSAHFAVTP
jgi:hypothetical protein